MPSILTYLSASLLYGIAGWYFWRAMRTDTSAAGAVPNVRLQQYVMLLPLLVHGLVLYHAVFMDNVLSFGVGNAISAIVWLTAVIYWVSGFFSSLRGLQNLIAPLSAIAAVAVLIPLLLPSIHPLAHAGMTAFKAHLLAAMLAYSLFTIAALHAVLMTLLERRLHHSEVSPIFSQLPPLLVMEKCYSVLYGLDLSCSASLCSVALFSRRNYSASLSHSHINHYSVSFPGEYLPLYWQEGICTGGAAALPFAGCWLDLLHLFCPTSAANSCWKSFSTGNQDSGSHCADQQQFFLRIAESFFCHY